MIANDGLRFRPEQGFKLIVVENARLRVGMNKVDGQAVIFQLL